MTEVSAEAQMETDFNTLLCKSAFEQKYIQKEYAMLKKVISQQ